MNRVQIVQKISDYFPSLNIEVESLPTLEFNQIAKRPLLGGLCSNKFICDSKNFHFSNLDNYLKQIIYV